LSEAKAGLSRRPAGHLYVWALARLAEEHAAHHAADAAERDLDDAYSALASVEPTGSGLWTHFDSTRLDGYAGKVALLLGKPRALDMLESTLAATDAALLKIRAAIMIDLAVARVQPSDCDPNRAAELLVEAGNISRTGDMMGMLALVVSIRNQYLGRWSDMPSVKALDESLQDAQGNGLACGWCT
jgi:hypothetical protein